MNISEYKFSDDEILQLNECRDLQPDIRLKIRFIGLLMLAEGVETHKVAPILGKSITGVSEISLSKSPKPLINKPFRTRVNIHKRTVGENPLIGYPNYNF